MVLRLSRCAVGFGGFGVKDGPYPVLGMVRRLRKNGAPFMVAVLHEDLHLPAGSELHLRRLHDGRLDSPEFALQFVPASAALTKRETAQARDARLDGSALRHDERDATEHHP